MDFIDIKTQQEHIRDKIERNINKVLDHGKYINGPEVQELEEKLADFIGVKYAIGVSSGTDALLMSLMAQDIGPGDAVLTTSFSFIATAEVISLLHATPVFVDIDKDTYNIDTNNLEKMILKILNNSKLKPKAIIPVDIFGQAADYNEINKLAKKYNLIIIEDGAQSFGGSYFGKKNCSLTDVATTSFFPSKPFACYGDGGMVFTNNKDMYDKLLSIRIHGKGTNKYDNIRIGINGRLDTIQAAIMLAKYNIFENEIELRQSIAKNYDSGLKGIVKIPFIKDCNISAWAQYSIQSKYREQIINNFNNNKIPSMIYYPKPLPFQKVFSYLNLKKGDFPVCERVCENILSLPMHPYLKIKDQKKIIEVLRKIIERA